MRESDPAGEASCKAAGTCTWLCGPGWPQLWPDVVGISLLPLPSHPAGGVDGPCPSTHPTFPCRHPSASCWLWQPPTLRPTLPARVAASPTCEKTAACLPACLLPLIALLGPCLGISYFGECHTAVYTLAQTDSYTPCDRRRCRFCQLRRQRLAAGKAAAYALLPATQGAAAAMATATGQIGRARF